MLPTIVFRILQITLFLVPIAIFTGTKDNFIIKQTVFQVFITFALGIFIIDIIEHKKKLKFDIPVLAIIIFIFLELISIFNAKHPQLVISLVYLHILLGFVYVLGTSLSEKQKEIIFNTLLATIFFVSLYGLLQYFGYDFFHWKTDFGRRPSSTFGNPNFFAGYLVLLIPISIIKILSSKQKINKTLWFAGSILLLTNLVLNKTRGLWIASFISLIYLFFGLKLYRKKVVLFVTLIVILTTGIFQGKKVLTYSVAKFNPNVSSVAERIFKWQTAWEMVKEHPLLGVGAGNLKVNFALYQARVRDKANFQLRGTSESNVHNDYFQIWAETGTLSLLSFLFIFALYFMQIFRKLFSNNITLPSNNSLKYQTIGISAGIVGFLVYCFSNFPLRIIPNAMTFFLFLGITQQYQNTLITNPKQKKRNIFLRILILVLCVGIIYKLSIIPFIADTHRNKGNIAVQTGNFENAISEYKKSIKLDYVNSERTAYDLGEMYRKLKNYDDAITAYKISIDIRNYGEVYNCLANCYWIKKNFSEAIKNWGIAVNLGLPNPKDQEIVIKNILIGKKMLYNNIK